MIIKRIWLNTDKKRHSSSRMETHAWFLFGIIPLYMEERRPGR